MKIINSILAIVFITLLNFSGSVSQQPYWTKNGKLVMSGDLTGHVVKAASQELMIKLDDETTEIRMEVRVNSLRTNTEPFDSLHFGFSEEKLLFEGKLGIARIDTYIHPTQNFDFSGTLYSYTSVPSDKVKISSVLGKGKIMHISDENRIASCILNLSFDLNVDSLKTKPSIDGLSGNIHVEIVQSILGKY